MRPNLSETSYEIFQWVRTTKKMAKKKRIETTIKNKVYYSIIVLLV